MDQQSVRCSVCGHEKPAEETMPFIVLSEKMDQLLHHHWQRLLEIQHMQTEMIEDLANRKKV